MRNIAEIIKDDRNDKQLSQTERQIATAYIQGKYDAIRELKIGNNSNTNNVLDEIRAEIESITPKAHIRTGKLSIDTELMIPLDRVLKVIDKYKTGK